MNDYQISPKLDALIQAIYRGPLEAKPWQGFLNLLREAVGASYATLILRPPSQVDDGVVLNAVVKSADVYDSYNDKYFALDPFVDLPPGQIVTLQEFVDRDKLQDSEYYQQYIAAIDVFHIMGADMLVTGGLNARLRLTRSEAAGDFQAPEKAICQILLPHLQQSILLHASLKSTEVERAIYADAIDQLAMGSIILDGSANLLRTNKAAEKLLNDHPQLQTRAGQLQVGNRQENKAFRALVEQVLAAHHRAEPGLVKAFRVGQTEAANSLGFLVRPLPLVESSQDDSHPSVVIFISDSSQRRIAPAEVLAELFGFTPAESILALLLANGLTLDEASEELGVSRNTAKSHLSSVFSKTGLTRQTKLVQLILKSVAPFGAA